MGMTAPCGAVDAVSPSPSWVAEGNQAAAGFGIFSTTAGDINGDGYDDVIIGAWGYTNGQSQEGAVFLYLGSASGLAALPAWKIEGNEAGLRLGRPIAPAGDVNGDGFDDVIVAAELYDNGENNEGRAWVYLGSPTGLAAAAAWTAEGDQAYAQFGSAVHSAGDVNGDGYDDLLIGAVGYANGTPLEGAAFVYLGSATGPAATPVWTSEGEQYASFFGGWAAGVGDLNGDGYDDIAIGAMWYDNGQTDEGRAYVHLGGPAGPSPAPSWIGELDSPSANFGGPVQPAGDVNGDGYDDMIIGADDYTNGQNGEGGAFLFLGSPSGPGHVPDWTGEGNQSAATLGWANAAGDVNSDGYDDVILGAQHYDNGQSNEGAAWVYLGSPTGLRTTPAWFGEPNQPSVDYGWPVWSAGDVNGDGADDIIVGANRNDNDQTDEGRAYVYHGINATGDLDGDSYSPASGDCDDTNSQTYPGAFEVNDGADNQCSGDPGDGLVDEISGAIGFLDPLDDSELCWPAQVGATLYEVLRSTRPGFTSGCELTPVTDTCWSDPDTPPSRGVFYYLVRPAQPHLGSLGATSTGLERAESCSGTERLCGNGLDDDQDGLTDCADLDCHGIGACTVAVFSFTDGIASDDVAADALVSFFSAMAIGSGDFIRFTIATPQAPDLEWCSAEASFYRDQYLLHAPTGGISFSGTWDRWHREEGAPWIGPVTEPHENLFGEDCAGSYSWCSESGLAGRTLGVAPAEASVCEAFETFTCSDGTWTVTIRIGVDRFAACGF